MSLKDEAIAKIEHLADVSFQGDYKVMFDHYAIDGKVTKAGVVQLLMDAKIGNALTRTAWAQQALKALDLDKDGGVSLDEFQKATDSG